MKTKTVDLLLKSIPEDVKIYVDLYADIVVRINQILAEKGITKKELADKMDKQPSEISKWLGGDHNFTLKSLAKLSAELGEELLMVKPAPLQHIFIEGKVIKGHHFVNLKSREICHKEDNLIYDEPVKEEFRYAK